MAKKIYFILVVLISALGIYLGFNITIIPTKYLYLLIGFYVLNLLLILLLLFRKKKILRIIGIFLSIILIIISIGIAYVYNRTNTFFNKITNVKYETSNYSLLVLKCNNYENLEDLKNTGTYSNELDKNYDSALKELDEKVNLNKNKYNDIIGIVNDFLNNHIESIFINENYIDIIGENNPDFKDKIKVIDTITIKSINEKKELEQEIDKLGNFNIYISGIDTYGPITTVSRSDVNILATINIKDSKILLTNTPRDYYVQLHGTTGYKDKLTHAGVYGIDMSMQTLSDLYDTPIDYYVRVNFNSLITLVDAIGGVDIYSDLDFGSGYYHINYGWNHFDGKQALNYSRQRKVYMDGDRHRGRNQQQVIEAIIKKITESNDINNYLSLLNTLENSFQTNIDKKLINSFINLQVKKKFNWSVESTEVNGYDSGNYTYSYPGQYLYVMEPDYNTVETAKNRIKELLDKENSDN